MKKLALISVTTAAVELNRIMKSKDVDESLE